MPLKKIGYIQSTCKSITLTYRKVNSKLQHTKPRASTMPLNNLYLYLCMSNSSHICIFHVKLKNNESILQQIKPNSWLRLMDKNNEYHFESIQKNWEQCKKCMEIQVLLFPYRYYLSERQMTDYINKGKKQACYNSST